MLSMNNILKVSMTLFVIVGFSACGKKKGGSNAAASTGYIACPANGFYQNPTTGQTQYCTPGQQVFVGTTYNGQQICPQNGYVQTPYGMQSCVPGQFVQVGTQPGFNQFPGQQFPGQQFQQFPGQPFPGQQFGQQQNGCQQFSQMHGVPYAPQIRNGQLVCAPIGYY